MHASMHPCGQRDQRAAQQPHGRGVRRKRGLQPWLAELLRDPMRVVGRGWFAGAGLFCCETWADLTSGYLRILPTTIITATFSPTHAHPRVRKEGLTDGQAIGPAFPNAIRLVRGAREGWAALGRSSTWPPCNRYCGVCGFRRRVRN